MTKPPLAPGWAQKAPEGYVNKEETIKSGKYRRWVEPDPPLVQGLREAWVLLLTDRYTLKEICRELAQRGFTRSGERPWAWQNPSTGRWHHADNRLHEIFHNPFYAGWVVSRRFGIVLGEVRGRWEPVVTMDEFERGLAILRQRDRYKSRTRSSSRRSCTMSSSTPVLIQRCVCWYTASHGGRSLGIMRHAGAHDVAQPVEHFSQGVFALASRIKVRYGTINGHSSSVTSLGVAFRFMPPAQHSFVKVHNRLR